MIYFNEDQIPLRAGSTIIHSLPIFRAIKMHNTVFKKYILP